MQFYSQILGIEMLFSIVKLERDYATLRHTLLNKNCSNLHADSIHVLKIFRKLPRCAWQALKVCKNGQKNKNVYGRIRTCSLNRDYLSSALINWPIKADDGEYKSYLMHRIMLLSLFEWSNLVEAPIFFLSPSIFFLMFLFFWILSTWNHWIQ